MSTGMRITVSYKWQSIDEQGPHYKDIDREEVIYSAEPLTHMQIYFIIRKQNSGIVGDIAVKSIGCIPEQSTTP